MSPPDDVTEKAPNLAQVLFEKIQSIKKSHPEASQQIDDLEDEIRAAMIEMKGVVDGLPTERDQKLVTVVLINAVHRSVEGILTAGHVAE